MSMLRLNIFANIAAKLLTALLLLLAIPLLLRLLGADAYGLAVLFTSGISIASSLDFGLSTTLNREIAAAGETAAPRSTILPLAATLERLFWVMAVLAALCGLLVGPFVAEHWLLLGSLPAAEATPAVALMVAAISLQFPFILYSGGLLGLQKQVALSTVIAATALARSFGALGLLLTLHPSIRLYFWCQVAIGMVQALAARHLFWRALAPAAAAREFKLSELRRVRSFSLGMTGISISGMLLAQMDKIVISRFLPLREVAYYGVASTVAAALGIMASPIFNALFPRLTQAAAANDPDSMARLYHRASQFLSIFMWPLACLLVLYPRTVLLLWTGDAALAAAAAPALALLAAGSAINAAMHLPYAVQLAEGWTSLTLRMNLAALALLAPALCMAAARFGLSGAAVIWPVLNLGYIAILVHLMHRWLLPGHKWRWYLRDLGQPLLASLCACAVPAVAGLGWPRGAAGVAALAALYFVAAVAALLAAPEMRAAALQATAALANKLSRG